MECAVLPDPKKLCFIRTNLDSGTTYRTKMSPQNRSVPVVESQRYIINPTNPGGALDDSVEDRLHIGGRAADDAEHLGCCRLMLQRLAQSCVALLDLVEEPDVLDGDHRLVGEGLDQPYLAV